MSTTRSKKRAATVGSLLSPKTAHELQDLHNPRRPPYQCTANGESQKSEPWESASAPQQGCQSPQTMRTSGSESTFTEKLRENPKPQQTDAVHVSAVEPSIALNTATRVYTHVENM